MLLMNILSYRLMKMVIYNVLVLLLSGANLHAENDRAFRLASENGHLEIVRLLSNVDL